MFLILWRISRISLFFWSAHLESHVASCGYFKRSFQLVIVRFGMIYPYQELNQITRLLASYIPLTCVPQLLNNLILQYACVVIIKVAYATNLWRPLFVLVTNLIIKHSMSLLIKTVSVSLPRCMHEGLNSSVHRTQPQLAQPTMMRRNRLFLDNANATCIAMNRLYVAPDVCILFICSSAAWAASMQCWIQCYIHNQPRL